MPGLGNLNITLYDVFGYLLVGLVTSCGLIVLFWALLYDSAALDRPHLTGYDWTAALIAAYILGHLVQAIANGFFEHFRSLHPKAWWAWEWMPSELRTEIAKHAKVAPLHADATDADRETFAYKVFEICDIYDSQKDTSTGDREIYQYREGFYRGLTVAFAIGLIAVIVRALHSGDALVGQHHFVTNGEYLTVCLALAAATYLSYQRYLRFFAFKLHNAYGSFATQLGLIQ